MSDILLIGSCEPFSGKSALVLGIAKRLLDHDKKVRVGKPLATCIELTNLSSMTYEGLIDDDVKFIGSTLNIGEENLISSVGLLDNISAEKRIANKDLNPGKGFEQIKELALNTIDRLDRDYQEGIFRDYVPYKTSYGVELNNIDDAIIFNNIHEGLHLGYMMAMVKSL